VQQHAVDRARHTTRCTCILQFLVEQAGRILSLSIYICICICNVNLHVAPLSKVSATWPNATHGQKNARQPVQTSLVSSKIKPSLDNGHGQAGAFSCVLHVQLNEL
jgi:hypothetical protein